MSDPRDDLENALTAIYGLSGVLLAMGRHPDNGPASYLGGQLREHHEAADDAFSRIFKLGKYHATEEGP